jgi:hypothetical protein
MVPITKELRPVLVTLIKHSNSEFLFPNADGSQQTKYPRYLRDLCKTTKVKPFTFHAIRHFAATRASSKKAPIRGIQAMLGHEHIKTTSIYLQSLDETTKSVAETLISSPKKPVDTAKTFLGKLPKLAQSHTGSRGATSGKSITYGILKESIKVLMLFPVVHLKPGSVTSPWV